MKPYAQSISTFEAMFDGYAAAVARFNGTANERDAAKAFVPLFECLNWAVALDDRIGAHWAPDGKPLGWDWRDRVPGATIMRGVRFARNTVHHQWSDALMIDGGGFRFPRRFPTAFFEWVWRPAGDLPTLERPDPKGRAAYEDQLANEPARFALETLSEAFGFLKPLLEPQTIRA